MKIAEKLMGAQASQAGPRAVQSQPYTRVMDGARAKCVIKKKKKETAIFVKRLILVGKPFFDRTPKIWKLFLYFFFLKKNHLNTSSSTPMGSKDLPFGRGSVRSVDKTDNL